MEGKTVQGLRFWIMLSSIFNCCLSFSYWCIHSTSLISQHLWVFLEEINKSWPNSDTLIDTLFFVTIFVFFSIYSFLVFHLFFFLCLSCKLLTPKLCLMIYFWRVPQMKTWDLKCSLCTYPPFISRHLFLAQAHRQQTHWDLWHSGTGDSNFHLCIFAWSHT